ncbi:3'-5' exonuclease [Paenibacillus sp. N1-5-1-14]|uniref:3'-5' exonuclease n=1 Tax=Paenibacillus radicibacter TaxID=2972488 RepID=UPI0021590D14|nr:3'-5' exonuclease [Paenibacillus radicibacter]MCR8644699.1 3'-5' exonuclease [Paenibacillus radicibacter]
MFTNLTILDFETTGLDPMRDRVIEIAAIRVMDGKVVSEFSTLVQYEGKLSSKITEITGLTDEDLRYGMDELTAFKILNRFLGDNVIVAHNAAFDLSFLHHSLKRLAGRSFNNSFLDTLTISRDRTFYPYTLSETCKRFSIPLEGAHRALNDVHACWGLLENYYNEGPLDAYVNQLGYLRKYGPPKWVPDYANTVPQENVYEDKKRSQA